MAKVDKKERMIAIADYLFANPDKDRADVMAKYGKAWRLSIRTTDRIIKEAKEYNAERIAIQEAVKLEALKDVAREDIQAAILTREDALKILSDIAKGDKRNFDDEIIVPSDGDRIKAINQLSKMSGWDSVNKIDITTGGEKMEFKGFNFLPYTPEADELKNLADG